MAFILENRETASRGYEMIRAFAAEQRALAGTFGRILDLADDGLMRLDSVGDAGKRAFQIEAPGALAEQLHQAFAKYVKTRWIYQGVFSCMWRRTEYGEIFELNPAFQWCWTIRILRFLPSGLHLDDGFVELYGEFYGQTENDKIVQRVYYGKIEEELGGLKAVALDGLLDLVFRLARLVDADREKGRRKRERAAAEERELEDAADKAKTRRMFKARAKTFLRPDIAEIMNGDYGLAGKFVDFAANALGYQDAWGLAGYVAAKAGEKVEDVDDEDGHTYRLYMDPNKDRISNNVISLIFSKQDFLLGDLSETGFANRVKSALDELVEEYRAEAQKDGERAADDQYDELLTTLGRWSRTTSDF